MTKTNPSIRFQGFEDDWEQRKLGDVASYRNGKSHEKEQSTVGKFELVNLNSISIDGGLKDSGKFVNCDEDTLKINDLVMILSDIAHGKLLGRVALISIADRYILNQRVALLRLKNSVNPQFAFFVINAHQVYFHNLGVGTSQLNISKSDVESFSTGFPKYHEQQKIGQFFKQIDKTITLHQRQLELLKEQKKGFLQKMFPKAGETVPEIRFQGFADEWEKRKLGNLGLDISDGDWIESDHIFDEGEYRIIQTGNIGVGEYLDKPKNAKYFHQDDFYKLKANQIYPGDIMVCRLANPAGRAIIAPVMKKKMVTSVDVAVLRPSDDISMPFLVAQLNSPSNLNQVAVMASGSTRTRISRKNLEKETVYMPDINEQREIGQLIILADKIIDLHQRELNLLKELKKGFLQQMFT